MFMSPIYSKEAGKNSDDILDGNLFTFKLTRQGYQSLLESIAIHPKKKHMKKLIAHMHKYKFTPLPQQTDMVF